MKKLIYLILITPLTMFGQAFVWVNSGGGAQDDEAYCVALDPAGDVNITGSFSSNATIAGSLLTSTGLSDIFVAKYSSTGSNGWTSSSGGFPNAAGGHVLNTDINGNVYVIGEFEDTLVIGGTTLVSAGLTDIFISKYNSTGSLLWAIRAGGSGKEGGNSIRTDINGNVYITGYFSDTASFGAINVVSVGGQDIFVVKINSLGNFVWCTRAGGLFDDEGKGICVDNNSDIWIAGSFNDSAVFGATILLSTNPQPDMYVARLNPSGAFQWSVKGGGTGIDLAYEIATDDNDNSFVAGSFQNTANFGVNSVNTNGGDDIYLARLNSTGIFTWVSTAGGPLNDKAYAVSYDNSGKIYVTGSFDSVITFGANQYSGYGDKDVFAVSYNTSGNFLSSLIAGGPGFDRGYGITNNNTGDVYITGTYEQTASFGATSITSAGLHDIFVAKISGLNNMNDDSDSFNDWSIYPNPASSEIEIGLDVIHSGSVLRIYDSKGSLIRNRILSGDKKITENITDYESGLYLVQIISRNGKSISKSFIKQAGN